MQKNKNMNWVQTSGIPHTKKEAEKTLAKIKKEDKKKKFKMVKVCDRPLTYKEIEIKD